MNVESGRPTAYDAASGDTGERYGCSRGRPSPQSSQPPPPPSAENESQRRRLGGRDISGALRTIPRVALQRWAGGIEVRGEMDVFSRGHGIYMWSDNAATASA